MAQEGDELEYCNSLYALDPAELRTADEIPCILLARSFQALCEFGPFGAYPHSYRTGNYATRYVEHADSLAQDHGMCGDKEALNGSEVGVYLLPIISRKADTLIFLNAPYGSP